MRRRDHGSWVIWITIAVIAAYMATQYTGTPPIVIMPQRPPQRDKVPSRPARKWRPIFPSPPMLPEPVTPTRTATCLL